MKIRAPNKIQVGGHIYSVSFDADLEYTDDRGIVNHVKQTVRINPMRPASQKAEMLLHEILHIVNKIYNNSACSEAEVNCLSEGLAQVFSQLDIELDWSGVEIVNYPPKI